MQNPRHLHQNQLFLPVISGTRVHRTCNIFCLRLLLLDRSSASSFAFLFELMVLLLR